MEPEAPPKKQTRKERTPTGRGKRNRKKSGPLSCLPILIFNLLIAAGLSLLLIQGGCSASCVPVSINVIAFALVITFCWQLVWGYFREALLKIKGSLRTPWLRIRLESLLAALDSLHFIRWPIWSLWSTAAASCLVAYLCLGPFSPFRHSEMPPVVASFTVQGRDGSEAVIPAGGTAEAHFGEALRITARVEPSGVHCAWSLGQGHFSAVRDCAVIYLAPLDGAVDSLSVRVRSTCQTRDAFAGLGVRLTSP